MGCGASADKKEGAAQEDGADKKEGAATENKESEQSWTGWIISGGLDAVGGIAAIGGASLSMIGNGMACGVLTVADCATLGMVESIGDKRDEAYEDMKDGRDDVVAGFKCHTNTPYYRGEPGCNKKDWMAKIPDTTPVSAMFIPGTHDTLADRGGDLAECQSWSLQQQLESGIRCLDLRLKHDGDGMIAHHGVINLEKDDKKDVIPIIEKFLKENPTEAIFARVKKEGECGDHKCNFQDQFMADVKEVGTPEMWNLTCVRYGPLKDFRGKVTFIAYGSSIRLFIQTLDVQDEYETGDEDKKFKAIMDQAAKKQKGDGTMQINYTSAVGMDGWTCFKPPGAIAYNINKMVLDAKDKLTPGMYKMDFPGQALVDAILERNPSLAPKA